MEKVNRVPMEFPALSSLFVNPYKNTCFFAGISGSGKERLFDCLSRKEGKLPVRYLEVLMIS